MADFNYYYRYLQTGLDQAEGYLLRDDLFGHLSVTASPENPSYPTLALGWLLLYQVYITALADTIPERDTVDTVQRQMDLTRTKWRVAWEKKAAWEFRSRLRQWGNVVNDIRRAPEKNADYYPYEVRWRVLLELLQPEIPEISSDQQEQLTGLDRLMRVFLIPTDFIWQAEFSSAFPVEPYWYLWGLPNDTF
jgi:hypothetical protein